MPEDRLALDDNAITRIIRYPFDVFDGEQPPLPAGLTQEEVLVLGMKISDYIELATPSWDGYSRGKKTEIGTLTIVGFTAFNNRDVISTGSIVNHLRDIGGLRARHSASYLTRLMSNNADNL